MVGVVFGRRKTGSTVPRPAPKTARRVPKFDHLVTPAVYPRLFESRHFDIQSTGQKSHCVNTGYSHRNALF